MDNVIVKWEELKALVSDLELDVLKNDKGNNAAGVRVRKGLRTIKSKASELVKITTEIDKARKAAEKAAK
jgi:hypothetical protein